MPNKSFEVKATPVKDLLPGGRIYTLVYDSDFNYSGWDLVIACVHKEYNIWSLTLLKYTGALITVDTDGYNLRYVDTNKSFTIIEDKCVPPTV